VDLHIVDTLSFGHAENLGNVLGASVAEPHGPRIVGQVELNLELASVPACLRGIVVAVDHDVTYYASGRGMARLELTRFGGRFRAFGSGSNQTFPFVLDR